MPAEGEKVPVVFFPRFTTLCGADTDAFESVPIDTLGFQSITSSLFRGSWAGGATTPGISFQIKESPDLITWQNLGSAVAPAGAGVAMYNAVEPTQRYVKMVITLSAASGTPVITIWASGYAQKTVM